MCMGTTCGLGCGEMGYPCTGPQNLDASKGPVKLEAHMLGKGLIVQCEGPYACEVICKDNDCAGLELHCSVDGPCKLTCDATSCDGATVFCGTNACSATCFAPNRVTVNDPQMACHVTRCP